MDSEKILHLATCLSNVDEALKMVTSGYSIRLTITNLEDTATFVLSVNPDNKATCEFSDGFEKILANYKSSIEKAIVGLIR